MSENKSTYSAAEYEEKWSKFWLDKGFFHADSKSHKEPYVVLMPPPNVTSQLHLGHGLNNTLQDIFIRWKRMQGYEACWLPGVDHAGIATQMMVERALEKEGTSRKELGREAFFKRCQDWKEKYGGIIFEQLKAMGMSCDWERQAYTMDEHLSKAVRKIFVDLYKDGLIYRGERLVNWDCVLQTAVSDDEVENQEVNGKLWYFRYPIDGTDDYIPFATTRPETMLGDTALAVNPEDERFKGFVGKNAKLPFDGRLIPIVADDYVKSEFGTGCVKITPAHDPNDFELGKRHNLKFINIMNEDGTFNDQVPVEFQDKDRFDVRKEIIKAMKDKGLFDKDENYKTTIPHSERSKTIIEPRLSLQWYVKMEPLVKEAIEVAKDGRLNFFPESWKKTYLHWLENIQDWCISRQLWWGHRIPIWYCKDCEGVTCSMEDTDSCSHCNSKNLEQDQDVLDTWFSSWLWPLSPFGWPDNSEDLNKFYPSNVLVTANEIIFLWVARMVIVGLREKGKVPFKDVFFNPVICDKQGRKFSKTLGNGIDPLEVIEHHGADAVRFTCVNIASVGGRVKMSKEDFDTGGRFINKIWNAYRFLTTSLDASREIKPLADVDLDLPSQWLLSQFAKTTATLENHLENYRTYEAVNTLYHFIWGDFCDWGLECAKQALSEKGTSQYDASASVLVYVFNGAMRLASPIIPFISEEIWQQLPKHPDWDKPQSLVIAQFPKAEQIKFDEKAASSWETAQSLINELRSVKSQAQLPRKTDTVVSILTSPENMGVFEATKPWILRLAGIKGIIAKGDSGPDKCLVAIGKGFEAFYPVEADFDISAEVQRLTGEQQRIEKILSGIEKKLANKNFVDRAPDDIIKQTKDQFDNMKSQLNSVKINLKSLSN